MPNQLTPLEIVVRAIDRIRKPLGRMTQSLEKFGKRAKSIGRGITRGLGLPLAAIGGAAAKMAFEQDKLLTRLRTLVGLSAEEVGAADEAIRRVSKTTGVAMGEVGLAFERITSAGQRGTAAIETLEAAVQSQAVGMGEAQVVARLVTGSIANYTDEVENAATVTNTLQKAIQLGVVPAEELAVNLERVIPAAADMGVSLQQVLGIAAGMSESEGNAARLATSLDAVFRSVNRFGAATGKGAAVLQKAGIDANEFSEAMGKDAVGALQMLGRSVQKTFGKDARAAFLQIFDAEAMKAINILIGENADKILETTRAVVAAKNAGGFAEAFGITSQSEAFKFNQGIAEMNTELEKLGAKILPPIVRFVTVVAKGVRAAADEFSTWSESTQNVALASGPLLVVFGAIMQFIGFLTPGFDKLGKGMLWIGEKVGPSVVKFGLRFTPILARMRIALVALRIPMLGALGPLLPIAAAIGAIVIAWKLFGPSSREMTLFWTFLGESIGNAVDALKEFIGLKEAEGPKQTQFGAQVAPDGTPIRRGPRDPRTGLFKNTVSGTVRVEVTGPGRVTGVDQSGPVHLAAPVGAAVPG